MDSLSRANLASVSVSDWLNSVDDPAATASPNEDIRSPGTKIRSVQVNSRDPCRSIEVCGFQWDAEKLGSPVKSDGELSRRELVPIQNA